MKITCSACQTQYAIADDKVPPQGARVRCRKCQGVFSIPPAPASALPAAVTPPAEPPAIRPAPLPTIPPAGTPLTPEPRPVAAAPEQSATTSPRTSAPGIPAGSPIPDGLAPGDRVRHERARRLARVLASDIAIYNQEKRDRGIRDGNLVAVLGYEIKKSWETYKERVSPELANATPYFRDALNEMLAGGKKIF